MGEDIDTLAASQLKEYFYVDDGILGGSQSKIDRMRGDCVDGSYTGTAAHILARGGMKIKFMAVTGSDDAFKKDQLYYAGKGHCSDEVWEVVLLSAADVQDLEMDWREFSRRNAHLWQDPIMKTVHWRPLDWVGQRHCDSQ